MVLVVLLTVRRDSADEYRAYERRAAAIMATHGGCIERTIVVASGSDDVLKEVHVVRFPGAAAFEAYRSDPALLALAAIRERCIISTETLVGEDGPDYGRESGGKG